MATIGSKRVMIAGSRQALRDALRHRRYRVFSCLNGFTLRALVNEGAYDPLLAQGQTAFVVDGLSARRNLRRHGLSAERICGRDLLDEALLVYTGPLFAIAGVGSSDARVLEALRRHTGRPIALSSPPMFGSPDEIQGYAHQVATSIAPGSLVLVFIRSPLQDLLAGRLAALTERTVFVNVGAVIDDILNQRLRTIRFFSALRLEWLYRLLVSPRRTVPKIGVMLRSPLDNREGAYEWIGL